MPEETFGRSGGTVGSPCHNREKGESMNPATSWTSYWNRKVKRLTIVDLKLIQVGSMALILIIVKLFPQITSLSIWWFVAILAVCGPRLVYIFWLRDDGAGRQVA